MTIKFFIQFVIFFLFAFGFLGPQYTNANIAPDFFIGDTSEYSTQITRLSLGLTSDLILTESSNGVYDITTNKVNSLIFMEFNITGFTRMSFSNFTLANVSQPVSLSSGDIMGELYIFMDGDVSKIGINNEQWPERSIGWTMGVPLGDHVLSVLYIGWNEDGSYVYDTESVTVRLRLETETFEPLVKKDFPLNLAYTDLFSTNNNVVLNGPATGFSYSGGDSFNIFKTPIFESNPDSILMNNGSTILQDSALFLPNSDDALRLTIETNSTGIKEIQMKSRSTLTKGISFLIDTSGLRELENQPTTISLIQGNNFIGVVTFSPLGIWHSEIPLANSYCNEAGILLEDCLNFKDDIDSAAAGIAINSTGPLIHMIGSQDFNAESAGISFRVSFESTILVSKTETEESPIFFGSFLLLPVLARRLRK